MEWNEKKLTILVFFFFPVHETELKLHHLCAPNISLGWEICQSSPSQHVAAHISANPSGGACVVCGTCHPLLWSHQLSDGSSFAHCRSLHATLGYFHVCVSNKSCSPGSSSSFFSFSWYCFLLVSLHSSSIFFCKAFHFARSLIPWVYSSLNL